MARDVLIFPMNPNPTHEFGRLSGYIDAYWLYAKKMGDKGYDPLVYLSHGSCHGDPAQCQDGYIWHDTGLRWHFDIVKNGTFVDKNLDYVTKTKWSKYVPPFRKYKDDTYWFLLKNLRKMKKPIYGEKTRGGRVLNVNLFWREIEGFEPKIHSSIFRTSWGAPWVVRCAIELPSQSDLEGEVDPLRELVINTITKRGGINEQTIEEAFLLKILSDGFDGKKVDAVWEQEGFKDSEAELYRFDMAFRLDDGEHYAVEFKKGYASDAPLQLANYINKSSFLRGKTPIPIIVCARKNDELVREMKQTFPKTRWRIIEFIPEIRFV